MSRAFRRPAGDNRGGRSVPPGRAGAIGARRDFLIGAVCVFVERADNGPWQTGTRRARRRRVSAAAGSDERGHGMNESAALFLAPPPTGRLEARLNAKHCQQCISVLVRSHFQGSSERLSCAHALYRTAGSPLTYRGCVRDGRQGQWRATRMTDKQFEQIETTGCTIGSTHLSASLVLQRCCICLAHRDFFVSWSVSGIRFAAKPTLEPKLAF